MIHRFKCWLFMKLCYDLKPEIMPWRIVDRDIEHMIEETLPSSIDVLSITVEPNTFHDVPCSAKARNLFKKENQ